MGAGGRGVSAGGDGQHVLLLCSNLEVTHISVFRTISKGQMRKWNLLSWGPSITGMRKVSAMTWVPCHGKQGFSIFFKRIGRAPSKPPGSPPSSNFLPIPIDIFFSYGYHREGEKDHLSKSATFTPVLTNNLNHSAGPISSKPQQSRVPTTICSRDHAGCREPQAEVLCIHYFIQQKCFLRFFGNAK